jgi:predicted AlkP superfamily phosphohydrolase/phosphomutase
MGCMFMQENSRNRRVAWGAAFLACTAIAGVVTLRAINRSPANVSAASNKNLIVLGIDGMDPQLLKQFMDAGRMPNFQTLAQHGSFLPLQTSIPPQSPVAWASIITGLNPGGHGLYDFIHRDPKTMSPFFSMAEVEAPKHNLHLGSWNIPLSSGRVKLLRQGKAFWQFLSERGIPVTVVKIPSNFPPVPNKGNTLAGMGTPDLLGGYGTFSFYTDDPVFQPGPVSGGAIYSVTEQGDRIQAELHGPPNSFRKGSPEVTIPFTVDRDPRTAAAVFTVQEQRFLLREKEWSPWINLDLTFVPGLESISGMCRFYLKQVRPQFELYVTPLNINPADPALPISTPEDYSEKLARDVGPFYTQGIAEDTKALTSGLLSDGEFLEQARFVFDDQHRIFEHELARYRGGMSFFYFSSLDQIGHMFWRSFDKKFAAYDPEVAARYGKVLEDYYAEMDAILGDTLRKAGPDTTVLVLSDHGFAPYRRSFNLNTWLLENGYLVLQKGASLDGRSIFRDADWPKTRAYGVGLNGLYLNLRGREKDGIVNGGAEANALMNEITAKLLAVRDPETHLPVITRMDLAKDVYSGPATALAPDMIVGYNRGYRVGWDSVLGGVPATLLDDNTEPWSGDHCMDYTLVPGVILSNRKIIDPKPSLIDVAPTILAQFAIPSSPAMKGQDIFTQSNTSTTSAAK